MHFWIIGNRALRQGCVPVADATSFRPPGFTSQAWPLRSLPKAAPNDSHQLATGGLQRSGFLTPRYRPPWIIMRGKGLPPTPAFLWFTKPSAIFKQLPKPDPCVITDFTRATPLDKTQWIWSMLSGKCCSCIPFRGCVSPNDNCVRIGGALEAHAGMLGFPISKQTQKDLPVQAVF